MKKLIALVLVLSMMVLGFAGCTSSDTSSDSTDTTEAAADGEATEVIVFAAASMTETLNELKTKYEEANPNITLTFNFASSGDLETQIKEGADCDLFISAAQKQMNEMDGSLIGDTEKNPDGLDLIDTSTRIDILENKVVLVTPEGNPKGIDSFVSLADHLIAGDILFAMGNSDVPVGQYTQKIFAYYGLNEETLAANGVISYGSDVKEVTTQVTAGSVDAGVVYCTDAYSAGLTPVAYATPAMCGQVIYPAAVLKNAKQAEAAKAFLDYLTTDEAMAVFEKVGFAAVTAE